MNGSGPTTTKQRPPPPPPLRLQQSSTSSNVGRRAPSAERGRDIASPTSRGGASATVPLLYELPPSSSSPRLRAAQLQQEKAKIRATLQTQYRLQQAREIGSRSGDAAAADVRQPRSGSNNAIGALQAEESQVDLDIGSPTTPIGARYSANGPPSSRRHSITPSHAAALMSPVRSDLEEFALQCKAWFFGQDAAAGKAMTNTLASIPPSQKATFTKLQASVRSAFHTWTSLRRLQDYRATMASSIPGGSLSPSARSLPWGAQARKERYERFARFVMAYCLASTPGTHPFFEGLYGVLRLQSTGEASGGAGPWRIEWEVDDAVFLESGGKDFTKDAIDALKGVLGFEERLASTDTSFEDTPNLGPAEDSDTDSSLLEDGPNTQTIVIPAVGVPKPVRPMGVRRATDSSIPSPPTESSPSFGGRQAPIPPPRVAQSNSGMLGPNRNRASSDPFSDPSAGSSPGQGPSSVYLSKAGASTLSGIGEDEKVPTPPFGSSPSFSAFQHNRHQSVPLPASASHLSRLGASQSQSSPYGSSTPIDSFPPASPSYATFLQHDLDLEQLLATPDGPYAIGYKPPTQAELDLLHTPQLRVWVVPPYLTNPEIDALLTIFPTFIAKRPLSRFRQSTPPATSLSSKKRESQHGHGGDLEEGINMDVEAVPVTLPSDRKSEVKKGTGRMWIGDRARDDGWRGGVWTRFVLWLRHMFR